jgi:hypothetical protein
MTEIQNSKPVYDLEKSKWPKFLFFISKCSLEFSSCDLEFRKFGNWSLRFICYL